MSPTLAVRPMHPPAFETIPELSPVLDYSSSSSSVGASKTNNYLTSSFNSNDAQLSSLHPQQVEYTPLGRVIPKRPSTAPSGSTASGAAPATTVHRPQLPPLNTTAVVLPQPIATYPIYPGLQTTPVTTTSIMMSTSSPTGTLAERRKMPDPKPLNRPRKISATGYARESSSSAQNTSSPTQQQEQVVYTTQQQQQQQLYQPYRVASAQYQSPTAVSSPTIPRTPRVKQRLSPQPNELFGTLPGEVLEVVLECLKDLHLDPDSNSCSTCWTRDLCSLSLTSRKWSKVAQLSLYDDIHIIGADSATHRKRFKLTQGCRMTLLRRTLRASSHLAGTVRSLKVPMPTAENCDPTPSKALGGISPRDAYENRVASLIMACPNLEVLAGPIASHSHNRFNRITHALSTRTNLKTMNWRIEAFDACSSSSGLDSARPGSSACERSIFSSAMDALMPAPLDAAQEMSFLGHHRAWTSLSSLSIHCLPGASLAPATLLQRALTCLPGLQHLHLSCVSPNAFSDATLLALPPLRTLALSHIAGISSHGLSSFATRPNSRSLQHLHLRHTPLTSLPALARLLSHLRSLESMSLVQDFSPLMPSDDDVFALWMMPYLASHTLTKLHWDIMAHLPPGTISDADDILARSIEAGGFPALRTLRAPNDPDGIFQALCRPLEVIASSSDRIWANGGRAGSSHGRARSASTSTSSTSSILTPMTARFGALPKSATATSLPTGIGGGIGGGGMFAAAPPPHGTDLRAARIAAQTRLDDARPQFRFQVTVQSEQGQLVDSFGLGGYIGTVGSPIDYCLQPDAGASEEAGGLVDVPDIAAPGGEALHEGAAAAAGFGGNGGVGGATGCTGSWNWREGVVADKKEKEKWWHTERGRWVRPLLD